MSIIRPSTSIREPESAFPRIVCLVVSQFSLPSDYTDWEIDYYLRFEDWIPDKSGHVIFVIANKDPSAVVPLLQQIRRHPDFCTALCYVTGSVNPEIEQLADGDYRKPQYCGKDLVTFRSCSLHSMRVRPPFCQQAA